jgi:hypothetical protein
MVWVLVTGGLVTLTQLYLIQWAYRRGRTHGERAVYYRYYLPVCRARERFEKSIIEAAVEDDASAQRRNVQLLARNLRLKKKSILLAVKYGRVMARRKESSIERAVNLFMLAAEYISRSHPTR